MTYVGLYLHLFDLWSCVCANLQRRFSLENNSENRFCVDCKFFQKRPSYEIRGPLCLNDRYVSLKLTNPVMGDSVCRTRCRSARASGGKCQDGLFFQSRVGFFKRIKLMFTKRIKKKGDLTHVV